MWKKVKNVYNGRHAQVPVVQSLNDRWRIFHSDRVESKSVPKYFELSKLDLKIIEDKDAPIVEHGKRGMFDWAGVMPTALITPEESTVFLYYIGWAVRKDVPYHNNLGLLISKDNGVNFKKFSEGPVFSTSYKEPGYIGTISIIFDEGIFKGWYLSCRDWIEDNGKFEPVYDIKYAVSKNGIDWEPTGITCISLEEDEGGLSQSSVIKKDDGTYFMWFSARKKRDFRTNKNNSYKILCASSLDGINWKREDKSVGLSLSSEGWDSEMVEYPCVVKENNNLLMFYNGNGFGKSGIGLAKWNLKIHNLP
jgi:predicted GH43/DUF377 family glycosyl hydrolase